MGSDTKRDSMALRAMALRAAKQERMLDAMRLWDAADLLHDQERWRFMASAEMADVTVKAWIADARNLSDWMSADIDPMVDWPSGPTFSSKEAFTSYRQAVGMRYLGSFFRRRSYSLWLMPTEAQEALLVDARGLLVSLVGRCVLEGVGDSWAPLREAEAWLREEGS